MKRKVLFPILALILALGLVIPMAAPVVASPTTLTLVSSTATQTAGYTTTDPVADPLNASNYSGGGTWSNAVDLSSPHASWYDETLVTPAVWVSSADSPEGNTANDQWRLFKEEFTIPSGAVIISASLFMSADNSVEAYLNGTSVGTADDAVFGTAPGPPFSDPADYHFRFLWGPFDLNPVEGTNTLMFVVRNWGSSGPNPTGLLYTAEIEYVQPSIEITKAAEPPSVKEGDTITYTYYVHNDGDVSLHTVSVTDSLLITVSPVLDGHPHNIGDTNDDGIFEPCETWVFTASYTVEWFYDCYTVENTATASAWYEAVEVTDESNLVVVDIERNPAIEVRKSGPTDVYFQSVNANYTYEVENVGDCGLLNVVLSDDMTSPAYVSGDDGDLDVMIPGEVWTYEATELLECPCETITCFTNKATVTAEDIKGTSVADEACWTVLVFQWQPRTIGYWGNWQNHYSETEILALLDAVEDQSDNIADHELEVYLGGGDDEIHDFLLGKNATPKGKMNYAKALKIMEKQLLAAWFNVKSYEDWVGTYNIIDFLGSPDAAMDPDAMVFLNGDAAGLFGSVTTVLDILQDIEDGKAGAWGKEEFQIAYVVLDKINNAEDNNYGKFIPPWFDPEACPLVLENKDSSDWSILVDVTYGKLFYNASGDEFEYIFCGCGLVENTEYSLIYYADSDPRFNVWGGNNPGALIATMTTDGCGSVFAAGSVDLGMDLPCSPDWNITPDPDYCDYHNTFDDYDHCSGAKIWLVPSSMYDATAKKVTSWQPTSFLFETDLITYTDTGP